MNCLRLLKSQGTSGWRTAGREQVCAIQLQLLPFWIGMRVGEWVGCIQYFLPGLWDFLVSIERTQPEDMLEKT